MGESVLDTIITQFVAVLRYPISPRERLFGLYLLSSLIFAGVAYIFSPNFKKDREDKRNLLAGLFAFIFPRKVWEHPSAWVDVKFFIPHQLLRLWIYTDFLMGFALLAQNGCITSLQFVTGREVIYKLPPDNIPLVLSFAAMSLLLIDFVGFFIHYLQHKTPVLWEFHKIHHSAEVLHPLSNYREHPVDNFAYGVASGVATGAVMGVFQFFSGVQPLGLIVPLMGITLYAFVYNLLGYNLRHSHIWVRWPGFLGYVFGCPAHHQIHRSCKPEHIDKNFAFMLPVWDVMFGTFLLPKHEIELDIGLGDGTERHYKGYFSIYALPFMNLFKRLTGGKGDERPEQGDS